MKQIKSTLTKFVGLFALVFSMTALSASADDAWLTNIQEGVAKAKAENKLVMLEFTGSDWCGPCKSMKKNVFSKKEFLSAAKENYVLVKIDLLKGDRALYQRSMKKMKKYKVKSVPTIVLLDGEGKEFSRFSASKFRSVTAFLEKLATEKKNKAN